MGLINAATGSISNVVGDQFKEFVTCPTVDNNVLMVRGVVSHGEGNSNPTEGVITNGSKIAVPQGWAMMLVDNGKVVEFSAEPGEYIYDNSSEPSIFTGNLGTSIMDSIKTIGSRITFGGQAARDQRVYYVNLLTITGNKFGSPQPKKITDEKYGMLEVTFFGEYAFRVVDPILLVNNVIGANPKDTIYYEEIVGTQLLSKFVEQLTQAISVVMRKHKVSFGDIGLYNSDISNEMNVCLDESWNKNYGLEITDVALGDINLTEESMDKVNKIDEASIFANKDLQSGLMATATAEAMKNAAGNDNGAMMGFMGMNMAGMAGSNVMATANQATPGTGYNPGNQQPEAGTIFGAAPEATPAPVAEEEKPEFRECPNCHAMGNGNFCANCGNKFE